MIASIACFLLGQVIGALLVDRCPEEIRFPEMGGLMRLADEMPRAPDVVLFGTSRLMGLPASRLEQTLAAERPGARPLILNASVPAGDPLTSDFLLAHLQAHGRAPRVAVIEVSPEVLTRRNRWIAAAVVRFLTWSDVIRAVPDLAASRTLNTAIGSRLAPFYRHRQHFRAWIARASGLAPARADPGPPGGYNLEGYQTRPLPSVEDAARLAREGAPQFGRWLRDYEIGGAASDGLLRFLARCRAAGIRPVILAVPATTSLRAMYTPDIERRFQAHMAELVRQGPGQYVDYRGRLDDRLFVDVYHLGPEGGTVLADLFAREVLAPLWSGTATPPDVPDGRVHANHDAEVVSGASDGYAIVSLRHFTVFPWMHGSRRTAPGP